MILSYFCCNFAHNVGGRKKSYYDLWFLLFNKIQLIFQVQNSKMLQMGLVFYNVMLPSKGMSATQSCRYYSIILRNMKKNLLPFKKGVKQATNSNKKLNQTHCQLKPSGTISTFKAEPPKLVETLDVFQDQEMIRHFSEEGFKQVYHAGRLQNGQRPSVCSQGGSSDVALEKKQKPMVNVTHKSPLNAQRAKKIQKNLLGRDRIRQGQLKQTCSTQSAISAEVKIQTERPIPKFIRDKLFRKSTIFQDNPAEKSKNKFENQFLQRQNFKIILKLGEGKFGKVFLVKDVVSGMVLAMKIIEKKRIIRQGLLEQFIRELRIQSYVKHPHIIELYGFFHDQTHFYTLMELGCDGQLYNLMNNKKMFSEESTSFVTKGLLEAVSYLHRNRILHRDLKPENIVLIMGNVKICDFGWAVNKAHSTELRSTYCGTPFYLSPQLLQGNRYDEKVDLWAIGILAYQLLLGCSPFDLCDQGDLQKIVTDQVTFPQGREVSKDFRNLIDAMLAKNPKDRLPSDQLLRLDFISKYSEFQTCQQICK